MSYLKGIVNYHLHLDNGIPTTGVHTPGDKQRQDLRSGVSVPTEGKLAQLIAEMKEEIADLRAQEKAGGKQSNALWDKGFPEGDFFSVCG